jgi:DNA polymerase-4
MKMKKNIIFHIDINNAFLSWTAVKLLKEGYEIDIRTIPSIIAGDEEKRHGVVLAKSPVAKKLGIKTAETIYSARKKCPNLEVFPPEHEYYQEMSKTFFKHLEKYTPNIEKLSVDECFMDMSNSSLLYDDLVLLAYKIKEEVKELYGFTVNIGISTSKICAKMASDMEKPNKVHTLFLNEIERKMWPLPVDELYMVGKHASEKLHSLGIDTIGDLAKTDEKTLIKHFNKHGITMHNYANGISDDLMVPSDDKNKSISTSETLSTDIGEKNKLLQVLYKQVDILGKDLRKQKLYTNTIAITYKNSDFVSYSKQLTLSTVTNSTEEISKYITNLFDQSWRNDKIRNIGVRFSNLTDKKQKQISIFTDNVEETKSDTVQETMDKINDKYGSSIIRQANLFTK